MGKVLEFKRTKDVTIKIDTDTVKEQEEVNPDDVAKLLRESFTPAEVDEILKELEAE